MSESSAVESQTRLRCEEDMIILPLTFGLVLAQIPPAKRCQELREENSQSLISITVQTNDPNGAVTLKHGTGFVISERGYVLTNSHLIPPNENQVQLVLLGSIGSQHSLPPHQLKLVGRDPSIDAAILQFQESTLKPKPLPIGDSGSEPDGSSLCSFGFPAELELVPTVGDLQNRDQQINQWWLTSLPISDGESGSPVFDNATGRVVGIRVGDRDDLHSSYVIPLHLVNRVYYDNTGLQLRPSPSVGALTKSLAEQVLENHLAAIKQRDHILWIQTLSSYDRDRQKEEQETPKIAWPELERKRKLAYKEAFEWALQFSPTWKLGDDSSGSPLIAATEAEVLGVGGASESKPYADVRLTFGPNALTDWKLEDCSPSRGDRTTYCCKGEG